MEDASEAESRGKSSAPTSPLILDESKTAKIPEFPLTLLQTQPKCEVEVVCKCDCICKF